MRCQCSSENEKDRGEKRGAGCGAGRHLEECYRNLLAESLNNKSNLRYLSSSEPVQCPDPDQQALVFKDFLFFKTFFMLIIPRNF